MDPGLMAAARRLPGRQHAIESLMTRDGEFRTMCSDLADTEATLLRLQQSSSPHRELRIAEYQALLDELTSEIAAALDRASVIPLADRRPGPRGTVR
jgi:hypothetical protein